VGASFEGRGEVLRRRWSLVAGAAVFYAISWLMVYARAPAWAALTEQGLALTLLVVFAMGLYRRQETGWVHADERGVRLNGQPVASRRRIASAYLLSSERPSVHVVVRSGVHFDVRFEDEGPARRFLDALGFGIGQSAVTFQAAYGSVRRRVMALLLFLAILETFALAVVPRLARPVGVAGLLPTYALLLAALALFTARFRVRVDVGSDGVMLRRLGERRFVSFRELESASVEGRAIVLTLARTGERVTLSGGMSQEQAASREALVRRIEEARAMHADAGDGDLGAAEAFVAPGGRTVDRWLREVRALARARDYREARVDTERLWRMLTDASAPPATRVGAAVALSSANDGETRERLRVASETCADPRLRVALGCVADGADDDEIEAALTSLLYDERD
jgi:hypothetical protein